MKPEKLDLDNSTFTIRKLRFSEGIWNDDTIAKLLSLLDSFYEDIEAVRADLSLGGAVPYYAFNPDVNDPTYKNQKGKNPDLQPLAIEENIAPNHLFVLRATVAQGKLEKLDLAADSITRKYNLPSIYYLYP
jgi:hypothetical protein